ncbi:MAG: protein tyrosine/serine phosphatase [Caulobacteraceae bacterium]|nr:protein tyrosine/serine phosphatase [Caulobacteraceae bacterium]
MTRHIALEGVDNFRDFGDYPAAGGRRLKRGALYRSASHSRATDADLERLAALEIAVVVDLRRREERAREPSRRPANFAGKVIANDQCHDEDSWHSHIASAELTADSFRAYLVDYYRAAPFDERHIDLFARYFRVLAEAEGPVLIHCAAGKDRTGILAALTHHLAGVHPDDIAADYLLTNDPERMARRLPVVSQAIQEISGRVPDEAAVMTAMGVDTLYLETAFSAIAERFGGLDAYLAQALGVTPAAREAVAARLLD